MATPSNKCTSMLLCTHQLFSPWDNARIEIIAVRINKRTNKQAKKKGSRTVARSSHPTPIVNRSKPHQNNAFSSPQRGTRTWDFNKLLWLFFFFSLWKMIRFFYSGIIFRNRIGYICWSIWSSLYLTVNENALFYSRFLLYSFSSCLCSNIK